MDVFHSRAASRLVSASIASLLALVGSTASAGQQCYPFTGPAPGTTFVVNDVLAVAGADVLWQAFENAAGGLVFGGSAEVTVSNEAGGTAAQELEATLIDTLFLFTRNDIDRVRFFYGDLSVDSGGANVNFAVNGDFRNVAALSTLNNQVVGGATVTVAFVGGVGFETGTVEITAPQGVVIESFLVGGQEFFLDDVCHHW